MYQVKCDEYVLYDVRDEALILLNPKVKVEVNTVGEGSFTIYDTHPYFDKLQPLKSIFEVSDEIGVIFRGRMTTDTRDFYNGKAVDLEGLMAFFNDSVIKPYSFPDDFLEDEEYIETTKSGNVVEFFLKWLLGQHNSQVQDHQKFKLGNVTVSDPNNYISRSDENIQKTWDVLKSKLFESALGGYLCIRYENDGNYIDYMEDFELTNTQDIKFGANLLDLKHETNTSSTYSAIIPLGAEIESQAATEGEETATTKKRLTLESIPDGEITTDIFKITLENGLHALYSKSAVEKYGWILAPIDETTWDDVTEVSNLKSKSVLYMTGSAVMLSDTIEVKAVDLHFTDEEIRSFRIYRYVNVISEAHGLSASYKLTKLDIDIQNPQNTDITAGETRRTLTESIKKNTAKDGKDGKDGIDATTLRIDSSRGTVFKNSEVSTVLSAVIYKGNKRITDIDALHAEFGSSAYLEWKWQRLGETTFGTILSTDSRIGAGGFTFTLSPADVDTKVVFMCQLVTD